MQISNLILNEFYLKIIKQTTINSSMANFNSLNYQDFFVPGVKIIEKIGEGAQGSVYKVVYENKLACAKRYAREDCMKKELNMLFSAQSSGCVPKILGYFNEEYEHIIIMELFQGKTLKDLLKDNPSNKLINDITYKIFKSTRKLHSTGVIHNDLKPDNLMVELGRNYCSVKIIDLGLATYVGESPYPRSSLERIRKFPHLHPALADGGACSEDTDLYSLGRIMAYFQKYYKCQKDKKRQKRLYPQPAQKIFRKKLFERKCQVYTQNKLKSRLNFNRALELE